MKKHNFRQIAAICGVILLAALYIIALILAIFDHSESMKFFHTALIATVIVPILLWLFLFFRRK